MSNFQSSSLPERNPATHQSHRRQVFWQITAPFVVGILIILTLAVLSALSGDASISRWADISLIWLIIPSMLAALVILVLLAGVTYGVIWLIGTIPRYSRQAQDILVTIESKVKQVSDAVVEPVLRVESFKASLHALFRR